MCTTGKAALIAVAVIVGSLTTAEAGQVPGAASTPDRAISSRDRVYLSDQSSNTVSVVDPVGEKLLGRDPLGRSDAW